MGVLTGKPKLSNKMFCANTTDHREQIHTAMSKTLVPALMAVVFLRKHACIYTYYTVLMIY